jgi:hypothetical protein
MLLQGEDIVIPVGTYGSIAIKEAWFIEPDSSSPELSFSIENNTSSYWVPLTLQFDLGVLCDGEPRQWSVQMDLTVGYNAASPWYKKYDHIVTAASGKVRGCKTEIIRAALVHAVGRTSRVEGTVGNQVDLADELRAIKAKRAADQAAREAGEAARQAEKAAVAERMRLSALEEKAKREEERAAQEEEQAKDMERQRIAAREAAKKDAAERAKLSVACALIFKATADRKVGDLTVREAQQVKICQSLYMYPPR